MHYIRIYASADGASHLEDVDVPATPAGAALQSALLSVSGVIFRHAPHAGVTDWHNAPRRQFVVHLRGDTEVQVSDGEVRLIPAGSVVLAEDTTGKGHITRGLSDDRLMLFLPLPPS